ncbi:nucleotidyltransferase family protein [Clostridium gasigenes]|uniref:nucleotidyltransferase family protein n=1 Tax=Clostridium gasigenes TaxID=94869 RepID=UPI001C0AD022|nr:nucleotidyltransferase family protein [Clostridium gasigenes]MBU3131821.1 nucleotidyltransferase family protein [Clostridium gasigenes]
MDVSKIIVNIETSIRDAIEKLDKGAKKILLIVKEKKLIGVITDGDIRRWILKNGNISSSVELIMNTKPIVLTLENINRANKIMMEKSIEAIPIVNNNQEVLDVVFWSDFFYKRFSYNNTSNIPIVIMAGGKGTRLKPYTDIIPKGLIPIVDIPIIERIINNFIEYGFNDYYLTLNYKKDIIKAYFNQVNPYKISFIEEDKPLGTAGSLKLLDDILKERFFVTNCDILVEANYSKILEYHKVNKYKITVVAVLKNYVIPYGVLELNENGEIKGLNEKPKQEFLVNTGMYLLESEVIKYIPDNTYFDMPELITKVLKMGEVVGIYPISENNWLDIGEFEAMENAIEKLKV